MATPIEQLRAKMQAAGIPALLVTEPANVAWLTGFTGTYGRVVVTPTAAVFVTDSRYTIQAQEEVRDVPLVWFANPTNGDEFLGEKARGLGVKAMAFEAESTAYAAYKRLADRLAGIELVPAEDLFGALRMVKGPEELAKVREACAISDAAWTHIQRMIQPGVTEIDLTLDLEFYMRRSGAEVAFPSIVVSGERSARPHGKPSEKAIESGDFLTFDFGARVDGYNSDITRTVVVGAATDRHREIYGQVLKAQLAAIEAMKPGVLAKDIDAIARRVLDEKDLARYFGHGLGHGLGRLVHDSGRLAPTSTDVLEVGQIWTVEPGVYIEGFGGVRIEDDVVVTATGVEVLNRSPKDFLVLPTGR